MKLRRKWRDVKAFLAWTMAGLCLGIVLWPLFSILYHLLKRGLPGLSLAFFTSGTVPLGTPGGGLGNAMLGSFVVVIMSTIIAVPWGVFLGVILAQYKKTKLVRFLRYTVDLQLSLPSIVVGIFVYAVMVEPFRQFSAHAGATALSILLLPVIARTTEEGLRTLPAHIKEAGLALGIRPWRVHLNILLRAIRPIVMAGIFLGLARVGGETAPLLFTAFSSDHWPVDLSSRVPHLQLSEPIATLPVQIFQYATSGFDEWRQKAWTGAMVLVIWIMLVNIFAKLYFGKREST